MPAGRPINEAEDLRKPGIYALVCPFTGETRYIGQSKNMKKRLAGHLNGNSDLPVGRWCRKVKREGAEPQMRVVKECPKGRLDREEIKAIREHREAGCRLLNLQDGGKNPVTNGNGQGRDLWSIPGYKTPYMVLTNHFFPYAQWPRISKRLREIRDYNRSLKSEKEKLDFQLWCANVMTGCLTGDRLTRLEEYLIKLAPKVNAKYPGRMTLVYNDGVEDTPVAQNA